MIGIHKHLWNIQQDFDTSLLSLLLESNPLLMNPSFLDQQLKIPGPK